MVYIHLKVYIHLMDIHLMVSIHLKVYRYLKVSRYLTVSIHLKEIQGKAAPTPIPGVPFFWEQLREVVEQMACRFAQKD